jgi:hypothetical protein
MTLRDSKNRSQSSRPCAESAFRSRLPRTMEFSMAFLKLVSYLEGPGINVI